MLKEVKLKINISWKWLFFPLIYWNTHHKYNWSWLWSFENLNAQLSRFCSFILSVISQDHIWVTFKLWFGAEAFLFPFARFLTVGFLLNPQTFTKCRCPGPHSQRFWLHCVGECLMSGVFTAPQAALCAVRAESHCFAHP